ncbi:MAG TPA: diacylglycerol kinase family lipid kinase [Candidatus Aminicenantes bacterium]|nr:diacylglycerol kinase family lipid kinase [Candidatus Aminicenantes bacterium]HRY65148.1 diacylglycerol kinase family lipid kinase [Candidatus Aminicenantes bacterium]HRZ72384.1 diacylglycerol kinase family lipid kinase [Candidatus Aminicenantes bacterium]
MRHKTKVIVNPASNRGRTRKRWGEIRDGLKSFLREFKFEFTEKPQHATEIARAAIKEGTDLVVGVGGDGTMNEIANGFYEDRKIINPEATLGLVPSGTGCDLMRSLNIPPGLKAALQVLSDGPSVRLDVGRVRYRANDGRDEERFFLNIADFGLGGEVVREVTQRRLQRKASSYVRCLVTTMIRYRNKRVHIRVDGRPLPDGEYLIGAVANGRIFGKGMKVAPDARLDDGLFDSVLIRGFRFLEFCRHGWKLMNGSHVTHPKVTVVRGRKVEAWAEEGEDVLLELDGDQLGRLPATFEIIPRDLLVKGYLQPAP